MWVCLTLVAAATVFNSAAIWLIGERVGRRRLIPRQDAIDAATVIARVAQKAKRHPETRELLLQVADDLRRDAFNGGAA